MFKPYDTSSLTSAARLYGFEPSSLESFSDSMQSVPFSGSKLINPVFSTQAPSLQPAPSAPDLGAIAALFESDPATIFAQALFTAMVDNGHVFESQSNGCACCGHDHGVSAKTQIMNLSDQIQQRLDAGLDISNFSTLIASISELGDVDADLFASSLVETANAFAKAMLDAANEPADGDLPADATTTGTITIGGSASGTRGSATDEDWYGVELEAGVTYTFIMLRDGDNPHEDPLLILYDAAGNKLQENDDIEIDGDTSSGENRNSFITFTATESGTYYLGASGWSTTTGDYTLYAEEGTNRPDFTLEQSAFFLTSQFDNEEKWNKTDLTYDISALSDGAKTLALMAMDAWAEVSGLTFTAAAAGADPDIDFNEDNGEEDATQAFASSTTSNGFITSVTVTVSANWDTNSDGSADYSLNSYRYQTYLHEVGHAIGLGHAGPYNGQNVDDAGISYHVYNQDAWNYTVMSYRDQGEADSGTPRLVLAPQVVDIIAIQNFYGANAQTRSGDNVYGFNSTETGVLDFEGTFFNQGIRPPSLAIYDAGGTDTLDFSGYSANQVISLVEGSFSSIGDNTNTASTTDPLINNITIAVGTVIENAIGGSGNDSFVGNGANNVFTGNGGNDTYEGGGGDDTVAFAQGQSSYTFTLDQTGGQNILVVTSAAEGVDRINLANVEYVSFNNGAQLVGASALVGLEPPTPPVTDSTPPTPTIPAAPTAPTGLAGSNLTEGPDSLGFSDAAEVIYGLGGNDGLVMRGGNDIVFGGAGDDTIYGQDGDDQLFGDAGIDRLFGGDGDDILDGGADIDVLVSGAGNDTVIGGDGNDTIYSEGGDDTIYGGEGSDTIFGGAGNDRADGGPGVDVLIMGDGNDTVIAGLGDDVVYGQAGNDILDGGDGNDTIFGGAGNNTLFGGTGIDVLVTEGGNDAIYGGTDNDVIYSFGGDDIVDGGDGSDTIFGGEGNDTLRGGAGNDVIADVSGNDTLDGGDGNDVVNGLAGNDRLTGGNGDNIVLGGTGADTFFQAGTGTDRILDFQVGIDKIELSTSITSFQALIAGAQDITDAEGNNLVVLSNGDNGQFVLSNLTIADLSENDFIFTAVGNAESEVADKSGLSAPVSERLDTTDLDVVSQDLGLDLESDFTALMSRSAFADYFAFAHTDLANGWQQTNLFDFGSDDWVDADMFA